ncbi:YhgE/Pip domain-containing protein [Microbacterium rhizosphaerae]|uniref:YhgE/Pip domain-containing protein n=1 Tax=Microbacterium rhizosphaerae TaxID=1678237 RepID=A0ABZ0SLP6_9MICO|nr:YhgE/Pip domain-containing protein [Microbacterium rhizosphaerae]WPR89196.1 YhgE/Pip domain-containing protein [Microbacterium rhizosphaerae]
MILHIERARSRRPVTWLTIVGAILLPVVVGGILVVALYNPTSRLDSMHAAIVNNDQPVTINGQMVPLGRQLTAGLVKGSPTLDSNLDWTISNTSDAAKGLKDGTYQAVITIPKGFSAAATSIGGTTPEQATIRVTTSPQALVVDEAISQQVATTAASVMGTTLTETYLNKVFLGFTTLGDNLQSAAGGASQLADGAKQTADGATSLAAGVAGLSSGASGVSSGASGLSGGAANLSNGLNAWADGAAKAAAGLDKWAAGAQPIADGTSALAGGLTKTSEQLAQIPAVPPSAVDAINAVAGNPQKYKDQAAASAADLQQLASSCTPQGSQFCQELQVAADNAQKALPTFNSMIDSSGQMAAVVNGLPALQGGIATMAASAGQLAGGMQQLATGAQGAASGVDQLAAGARQLAGGGSQLAGGASQLAGGASQLAVGASGASDGASQLAGGATQLAGGVSSLASGLDKAASSIPRYTDAQAKDLASVVATPVATKGGSSSLFGASAIPLLATLALWVGSIGTFIAVQAVPRGSLTSRRSSAMLALRAYGPGAAIGAVQGLLVAGVVQLAASYDWGTWSLFAAVCVVAGLAFAAVNQALVAVFGGAGRWLAALVGVLVIATGIVSTVPAVLLSIASIMPTAPAYTAMLGVLGTSGGVGGAIVGLVVWGGLAFVATIVAVTRRRTVSAREVLRVQVA